MYIPHYEKSLFPQLCPAIFATEQIGERERRASGCQKAKPTAPCEVQGEHPWDPWRAPHKITAKFQAQKPSVGPSLARSKSPLSSASRFSHRARGLVLRHRPASLTPVGQLPHQTSLGPSRGRGAAPRQLRHRSPLTSDWPPRASWLPGASKLGEGARHSPVAELAWCFLCVAAPRRVWGFSVPVRDGTHARGPGSAEF